MREASEAPIAQVRKMLASAYVTLTWASTWATLAMMKSMGLHGHHVLTNSWKHRL